MTLSLPRFAVLDGGMATELVNRGHDAIDDDPLWSSRLLATNIQAVKEIHRSFLEAGSDIIETNTYQASISGFQKHLGLTENEAVGLFHQAVTCAREAVREFKGDRAPLVAGSIGPYGASQHDGSEYTGGYVDHMTMQELRDWHRPQVNALVEAGVDLLAFDTIPAQKEAEAIASLLSDFPDQKAWVSFSCRDGSHTVHGEELLDSIQSLRHCHQIVGVGINCTHPHHVTSLLKSIRNATPDKMVIVYPNSGEAWTPEKKWHGSAECRPLAEYVSEWMNHGAHWIGGCCRTGPAEIQAIREAMELFKQKMKGL